MCYVSYLESYRFIYIFDPRENLYGLHINYLAETGNQKHMNQLLNKALFRIFCHNCFGIFNTIYSRKFGFFVLKVLLKILLLENSKIILLINSKIKSRLTADIHIFIPNLSRKLERFTNIEPHT